MTYVSDELLECLTAQAHALGVPGFALGVLHEGKEEIVCAGLTNVEAPAAVDRHTLFQIGSTTKTVTAVAVMRLVEEGLLDLGVPVRRWVPELQLGDSAAAAQVTLHHLLTHTGGHDGDFFDNFGDGDNALSLACAAMGVLDQYGPVGELWSYSNAGFTIAGRAIEVATGTRFDHAVHELVLAPLGMHESYFSAADCITRPVAVGHQMRDGAPAVARPWSLPTQAAPAGGLSSSIQDQLIWARFHLGDGRTSTGRRLLTESAMREMQAPLVQAGGGRAAACGFSWLLQPTPGVIAHGGETNGQRSAFVIVPSRDFAVAMCTNGAEGAALHHQAVKQTLDSLSLPRPTFPNSPPADPAFLKGWIGEWESRLETLELSWLDDGLALAMRPSDVQLAVVPDAAPVAASPLEVRADGRLRVKTGPLAGARGELMSDGAGNPRWVRIFGRVHTTPAQVPSR